jgi:hypothetical protein
VAVTVRKLAVRGLASDEDEEQDSTIAINGDNILAEKCQN